MSKLLNLIHKSKSINQLEMKKSVWSTIIKVIIASSYRIAGHLASNSVFSNFFNLSSSCIMGKAFVSTRNYREVRLLVIHCSATRYDRDFPVEALRSSHKARDSADIGYHFYIHGTGATSLPTVFQPDRGVTRPDGNDHSVGKICYQG